MIIGVKNPTGNRACFAKQNGFLQGFFPQGKRVFFSQGFSFAKEKA
jgi:hypothetical protein